MSDLRLSGSQARGWAQAEEAAMERQAVRESGISHKSLDSGIVFWMLLVGVLLLGIFTYLPGQLDPAYGHNGQVVNMVQPQGTPDIDRQYSDINQSNANANLTNARAYQRQAVVWFIPMVCLMGFGIIVIVFKWITACR